jgi:uncharacterized membrane protein HdeD (DUF308 family)
MIFQSLGKVKRWSIMTSITLMALGVIMVICPPDYTDIMVLALGIVMIIGAATMWLDYISSKKALINYILLCVALILGILGASVLIFDDSVVKIISVIFGTVLILGSIIDIFNAFTYMRRAERRSWWVLIVLSCLQILFGLIILINPWWNDPQKLFDVVGGLLLFSSVVSMIRFIFLWPIKNV